MRKHVKKCLKYLRVDKLLALMCAPQSSWRLKRQKERWLGRQTRKSNQIHPSIEVTGTPSLLPEISMAVGCRLERDIAVWLSPDEGACPQLVLETNVHIGRNTYLGVFQPIHIGNSVMIGAYSYITSANHRYDRRDIPIIQQGFVGAPIVIEDDAWLGTHVVVLPGVTIGRGAIVAAGSVVNRDIPAYEVWGGVPAKFLKHRPE